MKIKSILVTVIAMTVLVAACSFSTAKLGELKFAKNDKSAPSATAFDVGDKIVVVATPTGAIGTHKVKFTLKMEGPNVKPGSDTVSQEVKVDGNDAATFSFTAATGGSVKVDVSMTDDSGKELDKKSGSFTIKAPPAPTPAADDKDADADKDDDKEEK
jgi:hypothetical protein